MSRLAQHLQSRVRGAVRIALHRTSFLPGERVLGTVSMDVFDTIPQAQLAVRLIGEQKLQYEAQFGRSQRVHDVTVEQLKLQVDLTGKRMLEKGNHEFPFEFALPRYTPHTFECYRAQVQNLDKVNVALDYKVEAALTIDSLLTPNVRSFAPFVVRPRRAYPKPQAVSASGEGAVSLFGLFNNGSCGVNVQLASDTYNTNSTIEARVSLDLHTSRTPQFISLALCEKATIDRVDEPYDDEERIASQDRVIAYQRFDAAPLVAPAGREAVLRLPITPNDVYGSAPLLPSLVSKVLSLEYSVVVECHFAMASSVRVAVPVTIIPH